MTYTVHSIDGVGGYPNRIASGSALAAILALLERCDTVEIDELQRLHLPKARLRAVQSAERTRPVAIATAEADSEGGEE